MMESPAVAIQNLILLDRRKRPLLQVPDFVLPDGEVCGVYGATSEGANLFLRCVAGILRPDAGTIIVYGVPLASKRSKTSAIGVMPREGGLFADYTAGENIRLAMRFSGPGKHSADERREERTRRGRITDILELDRWLRTPAKQLPDGVRQRLNLACALVHGPRLLVADDPWGRADLESRGLIERALRDFCDRGNTLLFTSPREEEITGLASEICLFDRTGPVARGTLDHLRQYLDGRETILVRVQERAELLGSRLRALAGVLDYSETRDSITIRAVPGSIRLTRLAEHVQDLGLELLDMHVKKPGLREIYATVVGQGDEG
jgi:ABC-2 type transport system ATP-binding protein